jgi:hypothetical protein
MSAKTSKAGRPGRSTYNKNKRTAAHERLRSMLEAAETEGFTGTVTVSVMAESGRLERIQSKTDRIE